ncbi:hypothetical protein [Alloactinosynnema sp. L-07]|nr:hypothetical protein [Alloactinosynnema sp. L-07]
MFPPIATESSAPAFSFRERGKHEHRSYGLQGKEYRDVVGRTTA